MKKLLCILAALVVISAVPMALSSALTPKEQAAGTASEVVQNAIGSIQDAVDAQNSLATKEMAETFAAEVARNAIGLVQAAVAAQK